MFRVSFFCIDLLPEDVDPSGELVRTQVQLRETVPLFVDLLIQFFQKLFQLFVFSLQLLFLFFRLFRVTAEDPLPLRERRSGT